MNDDDPRLLRAVQDYLGELEAGRRPDRRALAARFPDLADDMAPYLDALDVVHAAAPQLNAPEITPSAEALGDFRIVREIGRGGMGVVYEAVQLSLGRRVALKVLPFASALDGKHLQRFKTEAHAAAQLHHTNIVPVYAVGHERGVHFYAMQLIDGRPLDDVIRELRGDADPSATVDLKAGYTSTATSRRSVRGREGFRTAALLVEQVAGALEYAHNAGVIHRDIKPANLLLDAKGTVWVTDFGLAQVSADLGLTQTGDVFGTLRYMSPEQASGRRVDVDHRADVYSLGATFYELLTLVPVFPGRDRQTLLHQILNEEPRPPRQIDRSIPVELETIALKALAKSPADRYATAGEMAADLRRFLDERPIQARRPTLLDRGRKWVRRHPSAVGAAVVLLVCGVVGLAVSTLLVAREQTRTKAAYIRERQRAAEAEERFRLARKAADDMVRIAQEELADNPFMEGARKRMLEAALDYYQTFIEQRRDDPDAQAELEATRDGVKQIVADLAVLQGDRHTFLLREPSVLDDLKADLTQRAKLADLGTRTFEPYREMHRLSSEGKGKRLLDVARANETAIAKILSADQIRRLRQIGLQVQGPMAFRESDVATKLNLSADQRQQIRAVEADVFFVKFDSRRPGEPPVGPQRRPADELRKAAMKQILEVLTAEQMERWKAMTGDPFTGEVRPVPGFGPFPGGPPGPGGPRGPGGPGGPPGRIPR